MISIEVWVMFVVFVNQMVIGEGWMVFVIQFWWFVVSDDVCNGCEEVVWVWWVVWNIDNGFVWQNFLQVDCVSWVNFSCGNIVLCRVGIDSDNGCCVFCCFVDVIYNWLIGNYVINIVIF